MSTLVVQPELAQDAWPQTGLFLRFFAIQNAGLSGHANQGETWQFWRYFAQTVRSSVHAHRSYGDYVSCTAAPRINGHSHGLAAACEGSGLIGLSEERGRLRSEIVRKKFG
eukprot:449416-Pelagomonas_calceolata.AAC.4